MKNKRVLSFSLIILFFLILPIVLDVLEIPSNSDRFKSLPSNDLGHPSPYIFIANELTTSNEPVDILILGSSFGWTGLDASIIAECLSKEIDRNAKVLNFCSNWRGDDQYFILLRELLKKREVKLVLITQPVWSIQQQYTWHFRTSHYMRFSDNYLLSGLSTIDKITWYGHLVLGAPRQLLSAIRPNIRPNKIPHSETFGSMLKKKGFNGEMFENFEPEVNNDIYQTTGSIESVDEFVDLNHTFPEFQTFWMKKIRDTLNINKVSHAQISIPIWSHRNDKEIKRSASLNDIYQCDLIGITPYKLFGEMKLQEQKLFFYNEHMNYNGAKYFTKSVIKKIIEYYKLNSNKSV